MNKFLYTLLILFRLSQLNVQMKISDNSFIVVTGLSGDKKDFLLKLIKNCEKNHQSISCRVYMHVTFVVSNLDAENVNSNIS